MAIIYTYPVKTTPVDADLVLISDSADNNNTKQVTISSIKGLTAGVTSIIAGTNVTISSTGASGTGDVTVNAASGSSVDTFTNAFGTYITGTTNSTATGAVNMGTIDLSATGTASSTTFLRGDNTWATPPGGGISFSGSTVNGIATYSSATQANVSSAFTVSVNKLSAPAGTLADPSLEVGTVGGLYAASGGIFLAHSGANAIGVNSSSIVNYKLTQFDSGLKFGSSGDTLSDYDVGTWSPKIQNIGGTVDYDTGTGSYTIIGDVVHADFSIPITATVSSTYFRLSVPFTPAGSISAINLTGNADPNTGADSTGWVSGKTISTGYGIFLSYATTNGLAVSTSATITDGNTISGSMTYKK